MTVGSRGTRQPVSSFCLREADWDSFCSLGVTYEVNSKDEKETEWTVIWGEDPDERLVNVSDKPVRILHDFVLFDPKSYKYIPLNYLHDPEGRNYDFEAAGYASPVFVNEEDAVEDEDEDEEPQRRLRTSSVFSYSVDYTNANEWVVSLPVLLRRPAGLLTACMQAIVHPDDACVVHRSVGGERVRVVAHAFLSSPPRRAAARVGGPGRRAVHVRRIQEEV